MGVVENTLVSESVEEIAAFVGSRTVYSLQQIRELAQGPVLSILFRQDRHLSAPIFATELVDNFVAGRAPQQISAIRPEGSQWIRAQVTER